MEILIYIIFIVLTFLGVTNYPVLLYMTLFPMGYIRFLGGGGPAVLISWLVWSLLDKFIWIPLMNKPMPILLFLLCWIAKLIDDHLQEKRNPYGKSTQSVHITRNMGEAWVLFVWAIIAMFGNYREWY